MARAEGVEDLSDIKLDDDHIYESARENDGSVTSYSTIRTHKSQPSLSSVIIKDEVKSIPSKKSSSSSSSSSSSPSLSEKVSVKSLPSRKSSVSSSSSSSSSDNFEAEVRHSGDDIIHVVEEPIYSNVKRDQIVHDPIQFMSEDPEKVDVMDAATSASLSSSDSSSSSSSSSEEEEEEESDGDMIIAEHTVSQTTETQDYIEQRIETIINQPMPTIEFGSDWDLPGEVEQMEREILESERRYSKAGSNEARVDNQYSSQFSHQSYQSSNMDVFEVETKHSVVEDSLGYLGTPNMTSTQLDNRERAGSSSSSSSSSSSDGPTKTLAESDLTIPLSQQMYGTASISGDLRGNQKMIAVMSSSSTSLDSVEVATIKEARKVDYHSSEASSVSASPMVIKKAVKVNYESSEDSETPRMIRKATPVTNHSVSSSDSEESDVNIKPMSRIDEVNEDSTTFDLELTELIMLENGKEKPKTKQMRGSNHLSVPRAADSRMERISETSENGRKSSSEAEDAQRNVVRRHSSGITSSSFIAKLSPEYTSVYSREEEQKRRSRDQTVYSQQWSVDKVINS